MRLIGGITEIVYIKSTDPVTEKESENVVIPVTFYHRVALGLESNTTVYVAPINADSSPSGVDEIIITTFNPEWWKEMYRVSLKMPEEPGSVAKALGIIRNHGANIGILETVTTESVAAESKKGAHHVLETVTTESIAAVSKKGTHHLLIYMHDKAGKANDIKRELGAIAKEHETSALSMDRLDRLEKCAATSKNDKPDAVDVIIEKKRLMIPGEKFNTLGTRGRPTRALIYSDTEEKFIHCYFPKPEQILLGITVRHEDKIGALAAFTEPMKGMGVNILSSFSRLILAKESAEWKAIIDITNSTGSVGDLLNVVKNSKIQINSIDGASSASTGGDSATSTDGEPTDTAITNLTLSYTPNAGKRSTSIPVGDATFTGRQDLIDRILSVSVPEGQPWGNPNFLLSGFTGSGKATLMDHINNVLTNEDRYKDRAVYISVALTELSMAKFWTKVCAEINKIAGHRGYAGVGATDLYDAPVKTEMAESEAMDVFINSVSEMDKTFVVFIDKAHYLVHPSENHREVAIRTLNEMVLVNKRLAQHRRNDARVSWILSDQNSWNRSHPLEGNPLGDFNRVALKPLQKSEVPMTAGRQGQPKPGGKAATPDTKPEVAIEHLNEPTLLLQKLLTKLAGEQRPRLWEDLLTGFYQRILSACGYQPLYIVTVVRELIRLVNKAPFKIDVIDSSMITQGLISAADVLGRHFEDTRETLLIICRNRELRDLLSSGPEAKKVPLTRLLKPQYRYAQDDLETFPALIVEANESHGRAVDANESYVRVVQLFRLWARKHPLPS